MSEAQPNAFARNSDLIGVVSLLLAFAAPTLLVLGLVDAPWNPMAIAAYLVFAIAAGLSFSVVVTGSRGRAAGAAGLVLSIVCSPLFAGLALIAIAAE